MKHLEIIIATFDNWSLLWTFHNFVINNSSLANEDIELFKIIWSTAIDSNNWKNSDLTVGGKTTEARLKKLFELNDNAFSNIVRAASYQWR